MILVYVSVLISMLLTLIIGIPYLEFLKKRLYGQFIREEAPASHSLKAGTPTMGGLMIVVPALMGSILALVMDQRTSVETFIVLLAFVLFTLVGYQDDISKILKKQNKGLSARGKLFVQFLIALIPALYIVLAGKTDVSFFGLFSLNLGFLYPVFAIILITGSSNAVNLTDGLDGLAAMTSAVAFSAMSVILALNGNVGLAIISAAIAGSCGGFLYFNKYPAKVFMGDTGSIALGGVLGTIAVIGKIELWLLLIGIVFIIETLSVILQVISFKTTGNRIFKMSPIHHHFELSGWHETRVVKLFASVGFVFALAACLMKLFLL
jgi:phospho-N-acetylmuramoyl-pentapeptide-transferase